jgi:predicted metal-dependent hydrolase
MDGDAPARPKITPRSPGFDFEGLPRHWFADNPVRTHIANGANLLFPSGERFFVRSVRHYLPQLDDAALRDQVQGFCAQEARHGAAHHRQFETLRAQGYAPDRFLRAYEWVAWRVIEPAFSPAMRLSVTVALEHYTAIMAEGALAFGALEGAHPKMEALLKWHACEEIEHKSVAFDVLAKVAPSYALRMAGMALATAGLATFWAAATATLLWQDRAAGRTFTRRQLREAKQRDRSIVTDVFVAGMRRYARRDFHPGQHDDAHLAQAYLARAGLAVG